MTPRKPSLKLALKWLRPLAAAGLAVVALVGCGGSSTSAASTHAQKSSSEFNNILRHRNQFGSNEVIQNGTANEKKDVGNKPEFIFRLRFNGFLARFRAARLR